MDDIAGLREVGELLQAAQRPLFITGAGLSADSGLPTYRGVGGLYHDRFTEEGLSIQEALSHTIFMARPDISWKYQWQIFEAIQGARPNPGHEVLAAIERAKPQTWILTQNIDGYHRAAGSRNVIEIHGRYDHLCCTECGFETTIDAYQSTQEGGVIDLPPYCPDCKAVIRPKVVLFEEPLPREALHQLYKVLFGSPRDLVVAVGTTGMFSYIEQPVRLARERGVPTIEINPGETAISHLMDYRLSQKAAEALTALWRTAEPNDPPADPQSPER